MDDKLRAQVVSMLDQSWRDIEDRLDDLDRISRGGPRDVRDQVIVRAVCALVKAEATKRLLDRQALERGDKETK